MSADLEILFEDNHLLVVNKPPGMLSQGDLSGDLDVLTLAKQLIKTRDAKPGNVFLGLVHRLDRPVSGVMVVAKTSKAAGRLSSQFRERTTSKIYHAVVEGTPRRTSDELTHLLSRDRVGRVTRIVADRGEGKVARLRYRVMDALPDRSLVEVTLITGLSHQIRVQLSAAGHPILGDRKYGSVVGFRPGRIALHAMSIVFQHPVKKELVSVNAPFPMDWPFRKHG